MENNNRRNFLRKTVIGISGAAFIPAILNVSSRCSKRIPDGLI